MLTGRSGNTRVRGDTHSMEFAREFEHQSSRGHTLYGVREGVRGDTHSMEFERAEFEGSSRGHTLGSPKGGESMGHTICSPELLKPGSVIACVPEYRYVYS